VPKELNLLNQIEYGTAGCRQEIKLLNDDLRQINETLGTLKTTFAIVNGGATSGLISFNLPAPSTSPTTAAPI
jgi:hypothetical protein